MPSIVTHHLFAKDVLKNINKNINTDIYYIFSQSFDNLFYYNFFFPIKGKTIRKLGNTAQQTKINDFFKNILTYIKENNYKNNPNILGLIYGLICHYVLDSTAHPYIIYETGLINIDKKYLGGHAKMEVMIDAIMYQKKYNKPLYKENLANMLLPKIKFDNDIIKLLDDVFEKTFSIKNMGKIYENSYKTGNFILKYFVTDKTGIKKQIYKLKDLFPSDTMYQYLSFHIKKLDYTFLNNNHETWYYPSNKNIKRNLSFTDLYDEALKKGVEYINYINKYLHNEISLNNLLNKLGNLSYTTGIDCNDKRIMQYFKY